MCEEPPLAGSILVISVVWGEIHVWRAPIGRFYPRDLCSVRRDSCVKSSPLAGSILVISTVWGEIHVWRAPIGRFYPRDLYSVRRDSCVKSTHWQVLSSWSLQCEARFMCEEHPLAGSILVISTVWGEIHVWRAPIGRFYPRDLYSVRRDSCVKSTHWQVLSSWYLANSRCISLMH